MVFGRTAQYSKNNTADGTLRANFVETEKSNGKTAGVRLRRAAYRI
ncbi:MAG: hypothetical protein K2L54_00220 [Clostridiales bacterium]|nr:hypothetical protein [Clostridiales bacterium]